MTEEMSIEEYRALLKQEGKRRENHEQQEQIALFNFLRTLEGQYPVLKWIHAIPNGGFRSFTTAKAMKAEGVKSGVLDIFCPIPRKVKAKSEVGGLKIVGKIQAHGLYVEMKWGKNTLTANQHEFSDFANQQGYEVKVCYNWRDAAKEIFDYLDLPLPDGII